MFPFILLNMELKKKFKLVRCNMPTPTHICNKVTDTLDQSSPHVEAGICYITAALTPFIQFN